MCNNLYILELLILHVQVYKYLYWQKYKVDYLLYKIMFIYNTCNNLYILLI